MNLMLIFSAILLVFYAEEHILYGVITFNGLKSITMVFFVYLKDVKMELNILGGNFVLVLLHLL